ncbi:MAG: carboxypeptidase-like regulatory domain-containing protein [Mangrovibacterium sp.]
MTGKVIDSDGLGIPGVSIVQKGTATGTTSDMDGKYSLKVSKADAVLVFSFVGMKTLEQPISGRSAIDVTMETDAVGVDEVVVTAFQYMTQNQVWLHGVMIL